MLIVYYNSLHCLYTVTAITWVLQAPVIASNIKSVLHAHIKFPRIAQQNESEPEDAVHQLSGCGYPKQ